MSVWKEDTAGDLDLRLVRSFVAVAEELHFTRAAARLFLAQQAVSRHVAQLEHELGVALFDRTTRLVRLTAAGERFLPHAQRLLAIQDEAITAVSSRDRPLIVDVLEEGHTGSRVLERARELDPAVDLVARFGGGMATAVAELRSRRRDVAFGRIPSDEHRADDLARRSVRLEPLAVLLPHDHELARLEEVPCGRLAGAAVDISLGNPAATEWTELGAELLGLIGATPTSPHPPVHGHAETAVHLRAEGVPILTRIDAASVPGGVVRALTDPIPLYGWEVCWHADLRHPGLDALLAAVDDLVDRHGWLQRPAGSWLPEADERYALA